VVRFKNESIFEDIFQSGRYSCHTGLACRPADPADMAETIGKFPPPRQSVCKPSVLRKDIQDNAHACYFWQTIGELTRKVYEQMTQA
jgi:hypothetical protein